MRKLILLCLVLLIACDPSYEVEYPEITEEEFRAMSLEEQLSLYRGMAVYIDRPAFMEEVIIEQDVEPLILAYLEAEHDPADKSTMTDFLLDLHLKHGSTDPRVVAALQKHLSTERDEHLRAIYEIIIGRLQETPWTTYTSEREYFPDFMTNDPLAIEYIKQLQKTFNVGDRMSIRGFTKGIAQQGILHDFPEEGIFQIVYIAHVGWIDYLDAFSFSYLKDGEPIPAEQLMIERPAYWDVSIISRAEVRGILQKMHLESQIPVEPYAMREPDLESGTQLLVYGVLDKKENRCTSGHLDLVTGTVALEETRCQEHVDCCQQCLDAFEQSPAGIGPEGALCGSFASSNQMGKLCQDHFEKNPQTVSSCQMSI